MTERLLGVIVVNWKQNEITAQCLDSLKRQTAPHFVVLVENECREQSAFENREGIAVIKNAKNLGYSKAINQGLEVALKKQPFAVLLLNNDALFEKENALELMLESLQLDSQIGAVAAALVKGNACYLHKWAVLHPLLGPEFVGMNQKVDPPGAYDAEYLSACCLLIRRETLQDVGFWDESFFMYFDDMDWCHRARLKSWRLILQTAVFVAHRDSFTANTVPHLKHYHMGRSRRVFFLKHFKYRWWFFIGIFAYYAKKMWQSDSLNRSWLYWEVKGFVSPLLGKL